MNFKFTKVYIFKHHVVCVRKYHSCITNTLCGDSRYIASHLEFIQRSMFMISVTIMVLISWKIMPKHLLTLLYAYIDNVDIFITGHFVLMQAMKSTIPREVKFSWWLKEVWNQHHAVYNYHVFSKQDSFWKWGNECFSIQSIQFSGS